MLTVQRGFVHSSPRSPTTHRNLLSSRDMNSFVLSFIYLVLQWLKPVYEKVTLNTGDLRARRDS